MFMAGATHRELIVAGPAATNTVAAEGTATAGEIVMSPTMAGSLTERSRGPARGQAYLLRSPAGPAPELPITPPELDGVDLARHVPTAIRKHLLEGGREAEHRIATVAFLHFDGTDAIVEENGPEDLAERLHVVVRRVQEAAEENGVSFLGTDIDHDGGKIILVSGVPRRAGEDEQRMLLALRQITAEELPLGLRIGVNTGPVFAGDVGTAFRRTFTVMGDTVNLAARLMAKAEPGQVLATAEVLDRSSIRFETTAAAPVHGEGQAPAGDRLCRRRRLPGAGSPRRSAPPDRRRPRAGGARLRPGRRHRRCRAGGRDRRRPRNRQVAARRGAGRADGVRSDHDHHLRELRDHDPVRLHLVPRPRRSSGSRWDADKDTVARHLRQRVETDVPDLLPQLPLIGTALDLELPDTPETAALKPEFRRQAVARATARFLGATLDRPFVLMVEDAHHMDEASQGIMQDLAAELTGRPGLLCITRRPVDSGLTFDPADHVRTLRLSGLTVDQAAEALLAASDDSPMLPREIRVLAERSMGSPMFLEELWRAHRAGAPLDALPDSVDSAVTAQIDHLSATDRQILRYAAVLGTTFTGRELIDLLQPELEGVAESRPERLPRALEEFLNIERSGLIRFRSGIVRDCAYEGLPFRRRKELHGRAANALLARTGNDSEAELLSLHFFHAQHYEEAWRYALVAGNRAGQKYANIEAATLYQRALAAVGRLPDIEPPPGGLGVGEPGRCPRTGRRLPGRVTGVPPGAEASGHRRRRPGRTVPEGGMDARAGGPVLRGGQVDPPGPAHARGRRRRAGRPTPGPTDDLVCGCSPGSGAEPRSSHLVREGDR